MNEITVNSCSELNETLQQKKNEFRKIFILFTGSKDSEGNSWCPDCVKAEPVVKKTITKYSDQPSSLFVTAFVGARDVWKSAENAFRTSKDYRVRCVPTILKYGTSLRLEENQCADESLLEMLLEEE
ncbi:thioredoxin domain-containing protein 17-like protein [Leptotrombidium deliense]|uniref:Thioredoxin domain-containing protein 17 n=1 Tax=Leptotrombidium deliense TaxID=299467 RepID=A0A443SV57_9ACAR|nr:thioredoxin domain-containing protein 17-like protein [Leptotrombidium deliense]